MNIKNLKTTVPKPPKFRVGDVVAQLTVTRYLEHTDTNPNNGKKRNKAMHWYEVRCTCGTEEVVNQEQLNDTKSRCKNCVREHQRRIALGIVVENGNIGDDIPEHVATALRSKWA